MGGRWVRLEGAEPSGGRRSHYDEEDGRAEEYVVRGRRRQTAMLNRAWRKKGGAIHYVRLVARGDKKI
jgi:hypothetical protein